MSCDIAYYVNGTDDQLNSSKPDDKGLLGQFLVARGWKINRDKDKNEPQWHKWRRRWPVLYATDTTKWAADNGEDGGYIGGRGGFSAERVPANYAAALYSIPLENNGGTKTPGKIRYMTQMGYNRRMI